MPSFSSGAIEQVRAASDIVEIISASVPLKRAGANFVALCPFHKEKTPSFTVNPQKQIYYCFGCHQGGDVFSFIQNFEHITFVEALRRLAERARVPLETEGQPERHHRHLKETLLAIHEQIAQRWQTALNSDPGGELARAYLARRKVSEEAVRLFRIGYAPDAWDDTVNWARTKGFEPALVEQAGLIIHKDDTHYYDRFRGRLMFPICDEQGRVVAFSGRILSGDEKTAKYVNSPETPLFTKGRVIFGLDKAKRALLEAQQAIICEGQLDLIRVFTAGIQNIVAPQGTALTADHVRILKRYVDEVVLCFDSDSAGRQAAIRALDHLAPANLAVRVVTIPSPHDPDSFIAEFGAEKFRQLLAKAPGFYDFLLQDLCTQNDPNSDKGRINIVQEMGVALHKSNNAVLLDTYAQKTAQRLGVTAQAVRSEFNRLRPGQRAVAAAETDLDEPSESAAGVTRPPALELWLVKYLFVEECPLDWLAVHLNLEWVQHPGVRAILSSRLEQHRRKTWSGIAAFIASLEDQAIRNLVAEAASEGRTIPNPKQQLFDVVRRLRDQALDRELAKLLQKVQSTETAEAERIELLQRQAFLRQAKRAPLGPDPNAEPAPAPHSTEGGN